MRSVRPTEETFRALIPHIFRATTGSSQAGILACVHFHSRGAADAPLHTPPMMPEVFATELGFTVQVIRYSIDKLTRAGLLLRKGESGEDFYRWRVDYQALRSAANGFTTRPGIFGRQVPAGVPSEATA